MEASPRQQQLMQPQPPKSLEFWLNKATDPFVDDLQRQQSARSFCDQLNEELEGPQIACRILAHKIQSPMELEALSALSVLDLCVRNCGPRFHNEMAKFRFLNELIKILSPKYLGDRTADKVKTRAVELFYSWSRSLKHLPKIGQAYQMLRDQKIIVADPKYMDEIYEPPPPPPKSKHSSIMDDDKEKLLSTLLQSKNPEDLQAANRLIKSVVKEEEKRVEQTSKRIEEIETLKNNARLLEEMLNGYSASGTTLPELDLVRELYEQLIADRPKLFQYAAEYAEKEDPMLVETLSLSDEIGRAIDEYKTKSLSAEHRTYVSQARKTSTASVPSSAASTNSALLLNLDVHARSNPPSSIAVNIPIGASDSHSSVGSSSLDDVNLLGCFGTPLVGRKFSSGTKDAASASSDINDLFGPIKPTNPNSNPTFNLPGLTTVTSSASSTIPLVVPKTEPLKPKGLLDLDELSASLMQQNLPVGSQLSSVVIKHKQKATLNDLTSKDGVSLSPLDPYGPTSSFTAGCSSTMTIPSVSLTTVASAVEPSDAKPRRILSSSNSASGIDSDSAGSTAVPPTPNPTPQQSGRASPINYSIINSAMGSSAAGLFNGNSAAASGAKPESVVRKYSDKYRPAPLDAVEIPLTAIKPGSRTHLVIMDQGGLRMVLHYVANRPREDVSAGVVSITSTRPESLSDVTFHGVVASEFISFGCLLKHQEPSAKQLPGYNPIFPQSAITQVLLLATSATLDKISLDYSLTFTYEGKCHSISGSFDMDLDTR